MGFGIHIHIHHQNDESKTEKLYREILGQLILINLQLKKIMSTDLELVQQLKEGFARTDAATTAIGEAVTAVADRIGKLTQAINEADIPQETKDELIAKIGDSGTHLESLAVVLADLAKDPTNPTPDPVPQPLPPIG